MDSSAKVVGPRLLNSSQWGLIDPIDTPDGGNIGLHKHLSISTYITTSSSSHPIIKWIRANRPLKLVLPTLCLFEKIINGIIDFIWSTLGIEALIPAPHIKLCSNSVDPDINDAIKLANDMNKTTSEPVKVPTDADFLYDITLDNGTVVRGLNYEQMRKYVKDHENIGYDFKF